MKILLVTPYYIPAWGFGGPVKVVADLAQALRQRGHAVTVATTDALDAKHRIERSEDVIDGVPVKYFRNVSAAAAFRWNVYLPRGFRSWLKQHVHEFDVIHCHDFYTGLNYVVSQVASRAGVPYVIQPHGALIPTRVTARFSALKRLWLVMFQRVLLGAALVLASTEQERQEIIRNQHLPANQVAVLPNGLALTEIYDRPAHPDKRTSLGISENDYVILYFGRIQYIKGLDISFRALALLSDLPWKYLVVGRDDGEQAGLQSLAAELGIADRIKWLGPQFGSDLDQLFGISDVFLFTTRSESFPISVLNACAAGLPVVAGPECRLPEITTWGAGALLSENTPAAAAAALRRVLPDRAGRQQMGQAGQKIVRELFTLDRVADQLVGLYQRVSHPNSPSNQKNDILST